MEPAATDRRDYRNFLLVAQFEAKAIGARIARARNEAGLKQEQLAEMASFSKRSLQDYEAGNTIPYRHMREISGLLGREVEWFLHGEPEQAPATSDQLAEVLRRLESLQAAVDVLPTADQMTRALDALRAAIDAQATQATQATHANTG